MANFKPLKNSILFYLNRLMAKHDLQPDFLDIGCGIGDVSAFLAEQGWTGTAIDISDLALAEARSILEMHPGVKLEKRNFFEMEGTFGTVLMFDILEHLAADEAALAKLASLVRSGGHAVIVVPSNPQRWGWDDEFYGHIRRYTQADIKTKLRDAGLEPLEILDFTFPAFTIMRGIYVHFAKPPAQSGGDSIRSERTLLSGMAPEWQKSSWAGRLAKAHIIWDWVYRMQFRFFRHRIRWGHEIIVLAIKRS